MKNQAFCGFYVFSGKYLTYVTGGMYCRSVSSLKADDEPAFET
jgi:hypothetical protein